MMSEYGLIGEKLGHSFSKELHRKFGNDGYELMEIPKDEIDGYFEKACFKGINVTIPYKQTAMRYCSADSTAAEIGAVNTMVNREGTVYGYNTDFLGFEYMLGRAGISLKGKKTVILGSGGTSKTARFVCKRAGAAEIVVLSRNADKEQTNSDNDKCIRFAAYGQTDEYTDADIIINTTPVGMFPKIDECPVDIALFPHLEGVADVIYNPRITRLLKAASERNIKNTGGLPMLVAQGWYANLLFRGEPAEKLMKLQPSNEMKDSFITVPEIERVIDVIQEAHRF